MRCLLSVMVFACTLMIGPMASHVRAAEPNACLRDCAAQPVIRLAQDERWQRCRATMNRCRARCPKEGSPGWDHCVTKCGETFEQCIGSN